MVKYCQVCGNASYDSAPICGNCGAKLPPKSEANSTPSSLNKSAQSSEPITSIFGEVKTKEEFIPEPVEESGFSSKRNKFRNRIEQALNNFDSKKKASNEEKKRVEEEKVINRQTSSKPSFNQTATIGFKQKDKGTKNPAKKFDFSKVDDDYINPKKEAKKAKLSKGEIKKIETPIKEVKTAKKEIKKETPIKKVKTEEKPNEETSKTGLSGLNFKRIAVIVVLALVVLAIAGVGISNIQNQPTNEVKHYSNGQMSFNYSGNWSEYNNNDDNNKSADMAFKTKDNTIIGYTTIQSDEITYKLIEEDINATAASLNGEVIQRNTVNIGNQSIVGADYIINTTNQGLSRYICILDDDVYYSFVINNGKSFNKSISSLNTTEIQNMVNSIHINNYVYDDDGY